MRNSFIPTVTILSSTINPGRTGSYNSGYSEGDVLYDSEGNAYFFDGNNWVDEDGKSYGPTPEPGWTADFP